MSDRAAATALLAPLVVALVFSWVRLAGAGSHVPDDADYLAARRALEAQGYARAQDALAILPPWSLRPLTTLGELEPISGDALAEQPLDRYARLFVLVEPDAQAPLAALRARLGEPASRERHGRIELLRWDLPPHALSFDFRARLADAKVAVDGAPCDRAAKGGVACGGEGWRRVTREWLLVSENADDAVWSHPPPRGAALEIAWDEVPLGEQLVVRAGFTREGADQARAPVRLRVLADEVELGSVVRAPAFAFATTRLDTRAYAGRRARVRFLIDTEDHEGARFAWDAFAVGGAR